jgi:hypothetical protein
VPTDWSLELSWLSEPGDALFSSDSFFLANFFQKDIVIVRNEF